MGPTSAIRWAHGSAAPRCDRPPRSRERAGARQWHRRIDDPGERAARRKSTSRPSPAARIERDGIDDFLDDWLSLPLFATLLADAAGLDIRRTNTTSGLASSLRQAGTGAQDPLWDRLGELTMPVLVVAGALDHKFVALARRLHASIPGSRLAIVEDAGHTVPLERPDQFVTLLTTWRP